MSHAAQARRLKNHIAGLETMTRFALAVLALASGVYTYLGVREPARRLGDLRVLRRDHLFGRRLGRDLRLLELHAPLRAADARRRLAAALFVTMAIGSAMIMAMSAWLNAAALAGSAALEQHLAVTVEGYTDDLDQAHGNALAAQSLLPDVQRAAERFARLADDERELGRADRHDRLGLRRAAADARCRRR